MNSQEYNGPKRLDSSKRSFPFVGKESLSQETKGPNLSPCEYIIESKLGQGVFGEVFFAVSEKTREEVALKRISKKNPKFEDNMVQREIAAGRTLHHEGVVEYKSFFETIHNMYLVYELIDGVDLCSYMSERDYNPVIEYETRKIVKQVIKAVIYCHGQGIAHRDIKLDNILITQDGTTKIIDFGLSSSKIKRGELCKDFVGSPEYAGPEILARKPYDPFTADVFSIGVVLYSLLFGEFPFSTSDRWERLSRGEHPPIRWADNRSVNFPHVISHEVKDLIEAMLEVNPKKRIPLEQALIHPWFRMRESAKIGKQTSSLMENVVETLDQFKLMEETSLRINTTIKIC